MTRLFVIGLDGATWNVIDPLIERGFLPTFRKLKEGGQTATLMSTLQSESGSAWTTLVTGKNPWEHGITGLMIRDPETREIRLATSCDVRSERIWETLGSYGKRSIVLNLPVTYPPTSLNGYMVAGLPASTASDIFYPPKLQLGNIPIDISRTSFDDGVSGDRSFLDECRRCVDRRLELTLSFMQRETWDFLLTVFTETDRLQHFFFYHDIECDAAKPLKEHYRHLDEVLAALIDAAGQDTIVMVVSDHGFAEGHKRLYLNNFLADQGFLKLRNKGSHKWALKSLVRPMGRIVAPYLIGWLGDKALGWRNTWRRWMSKGDNFFSGEGIDWNDTVAYADVDRGIHINLSGREPMGMVPPSGYDSVREKVRDTLIDYVDPETGEPVVKGVYRFEDIYPHTTANRVPDLVVEPLSDPHSPGRTYGELAVGPTPDGRPIRPNPLGLIGVHERPGILICCDPTDRLTLDRRVLDIHQVVPLMMKAVGVQAHTLSAGERSEPAKGNRALTDEEEEEVVSRLRGLGYLE